MVTVKPLLPAASRRSTVLPLEVKLTSPSFTVAVVATNAVSIVALAVAPDDTVRISPVLRSVTVSVSRVTVKVSSPAPPVKVSLPAPPIRVSLPAPPIRMSF